MSVGRVLLWWRVEVNRFFHVAEKEVGPLRKLLVDAYGFGLVGEGDVRLAVFADLHVRVADGDAVLASRDARDGDVVGIEAVSVRVCSEKSKAKKEAQRAREFPVRAL